MSDAPVGEGGQEGSGGPYNRRYPGYAPKGKPADYPRSPMTPEQGCFGCLTTIGVLLVTVAIWVCIYWWNEPDFHPKPAPPSETNKIRPVSSPPGKSGR